MEQPEQKSDAKLNGDESVFKLDGGQKTADENNPFVCRLSFSVIILLNRLRDSGFRFQKKNNVNVTNITNFQWQMSLFNNQ